MNLKPGWLRRQLLQVEEDIKKWPEWMRREAGFGIMPPVDPEARAAIISSCEQDLETYLREAQDLVLAMNFARWPPIMPELIPQAKRLAHVANVIEGILARWELAAKEGDDDASL